MTTIDERTNTPVALTDTAVSKVGELLAEQDETDLVLRLMAIPGGCAGFRYDMHFDTLVEESDTVTDFGDVKLVVDEASVPRLVGATIDFRDEGPMGSGFAIENPNETGHHCTCGKR